MNRYQHRYWDICDVCESQSSAYERFHVCRDCGNAVCENCMQPGTDVNDEGRLRCVCRECYEINLEEEENELEDAEDASDVDFS